jgi:hypothetical protein
LPKRDTDGRIYRKTYLFEPWYVKDNMWTRWTTWLEELGPLEFERASREPVREQAVAMGEYTDRTDGKLPGCPFAFGDELRWQ